MFRELEKKDRNKRKPHEMSLERIQAELKLNYGSVFLANFTFEVQHRTRFIPIPCYPQSTFVGERSPTRAWSMQQPNTRGSRVPSPQELARWLTSQKKRFVFETDTGIRHYSSTQRYYIMSISPHN